MHVRWHASLYFSCYQNHVAWNRIRNQHVWNILINTFAFSILSSMHHMVAPRFNLVRLKHSRITHRPIHKHLVLKVVKREISLKLFVILRRSFFRCLSLPLNQNLSQTHTIQFFVRIQLSIISSNIGIRVV